MDQVCDQPGLNVSIMVRQLRCDKFVLFSAGQLYIMELEMKQLSLRRAKPEQASRQPPRIGASRMKLKRTAQRHRGPATFLHLKIHLPLTVSHAVYEP